jgi:hypothetical protein
MKKWRNRTGNKIVRPLYSLNLVRPLYSFFKKMHNFVKQLYKGWKLFLTCKLTIVHKMSLLTLLKMRFFNWKQRILVPVRSCTNHPKKLFRLSCLNRESYKVINNRTVRGFYTGVPCGLVLHINLTVSLPKFHCFYRALKPPFYEPIVRFWSLSSIIIETRSKNLTSSFVRVTWWLSIDYSEGQGWTTWRAILLVALKTIQNFYTF